MATEAEKKQAQRILKAKGRLLWRLILTTPGVPDLAHHVEKDTPFDDLPKDEQITALVIVSHYEAGARGIEEEAAKRETEALEATAAKGDAQANAAEGAPETPAKAAETPPAIESETPTPGAA